MIKKLFTCIGLFLLFSAYMVNAQTNDAPLAPNSPFKHAIKNNIQATYFHNRNAFLLHPISPAYIVRTAAGNAHEFELNYLDFANMDSRQRASGSGYLYRLYNLGLRYQFNCFFIKRETKFAPYLGVTVRTDFLVEHATPASNRNPKSNTTEVEFSTAFVPGLNYNISKRVFLDFNLPIGLYELGYERKIVIDPTSTNPERRRSSFNVDVPLASFFQARFGVGVNF